MLLAALVTAAFFCALMFVEPPETGPVSNAHPTVWAPPSAMGLAGGVALVFIWMTWPPSVIGVTGLWRAAVVLCGLVILLSLAMGAGAIVLTPMPRPSEGAAALMIAVMVALAACGMGLVGVLARCSSWISVYVVSSRRAKGWRLVSYVSGAASFTIVLAVALLAASPGARSTGRGIWIVPMSVAFLAMVVALVLAVRHSLMGLLVDVRSPRE